MATSFSWSTKSEYVHDWVRILSLLSRVMLNRRAKKLYYISGTRRYYCVTIIIVGFRVLKPRNEFFEYFHTSIVPKGFLH